MSFVIWDVLLENFECLCNYVPTIMFIDVAFILGFDFHFRDYACSEIYNGCIWIEHIYQKHDFKKKLIKVKYMENVSLITNIIINNTITKILRIWFQDYAINRRIRKSEKKKKENKEKKYWCWLTQNKSQYSIFGLFDKNP